MIFQENDDLTNIYCTRGACPAVILSHVVFVKIHHSSLGKADKWGCSTANSQLGDSLKSQTPSGILNLYCICSAEIALYPFPSRCVATMQASEAGQGGNLLLVAEE